MSSQEFSEWMAYYRLEPWGPERADLNMGVLASLYANVKRDPKRSKAFQPQDFMPVYGGEERRQTVEEQVQLVHMLQEAFGGTITREE